MYKNYKVTDFPDNIRTIIANSGKKGEDIYWSKEYLEAVNTFEEYKHSSKEKMLEGVIKARLEVTELSQKLLKTDSRRQGYMFVAIALLFLLILISFALVLKNLGYSLSCDIPNCGID